MQPMRPSSDHPNTWYLVLRASFNTAAMPSTKPLWCVCRKYCKGKRRELHTLNTWRRHLREAAEDEVDSIRLAGRSDAFHAFIGSAGTPSSSSHKRPGDDVFRTVDTPKRPRMSQEPSPVSKSDYKC